MLALTLVLTLPLSLAALGGDGSAGVTVRLVLPRLLWRSDLGLGALYGLSTPPARTPPAVGWSHPTTPTLSPSPTRLCSGFAVQHRRVRAPRSGEKMELRAWAGTSLCRNRRCVLEAHEKVRRRATFGIRCSGHTGGAVVFVSGQRCGPAVCRADRRGFGLPSPVGMPRASRRTAAVRATSRTRSPPSDDSSR